MAMGKKIRKEGKTKANIHWRHKKPELHMEVETGMVEILRKKWKHHLNRRPD